MSLGRYFGSELKDCEAECNATSPVGICLVSACSRLDGRDIKRTGQNDGGGQSECWPKTSLKEPGRKGSTGQR